MNRDDIIRIAREAGFVTDEADFIYPPKTTRRGIGLEIERVIVLAAAAEREKVAAWMRSKSYATGHGDTVEDLLKELEWQVAEREREACAKTAEVYGLPGVGAVVAAVIRARGEQEQPR